MNPTTGRRLAASFTLLCLTAGAAAQGDPARTALDYLQRHAADLGLNAADVEETAVGDVVPGSTDRVTHVYLQQRYQGIDVWNGRMTVNVGADGSVVGTGEGFVADLAGSAGPSQPQQDAAQAARSAAAHLRLEPKRPIELLERRGGPAEELTLSDGGIAAGPIKARLVWVEAQRDVRLAWAVEIEALDGGHWWIALIDARTGESLGEHDLVVNHAALEH